MRLHTISLMADDPHMDHRRIPALVALLASALLIAACGGASAERVQEPDRVVNVVLRCSTGDPPRDMTGEYCQRFLQPDASDIYLSHYRVRQEVTVRTGSGGSYTIEVSPRVSVAVGDVWPQEGQ